MKKTLSPENPDQITNPDESKYPVSNNGSKSIKERIGAVISRRKLFSGAIALGALSVIGKLSNVIAV